MGKGKGIGAKQAKGSNGVAARSNTFGAGAADHSAHDALPSPSIVGAADPHLRTAVSSEDDDVRGLFDILRDPALYRLYVQDLGTAMSLEQEEKQIRSTRAN